MEERVFVSPAVAVHFNYIYLKKYRTTKIREGFTPLLLRQLVGEDDRNGV